MGEPQKHTVELEDGEPAAEACMPYTIYTVFPNMEIDTLLFICTHRSG